MFSSAAVVLSTVSYKKVKEAQMLDRQIVFVNTQQLTLWHLRFINHNWIRKSTIQIQRRTNSIVFMEPLQCLLHFFNVNFYVFFDFVSLE